MKIRNLMTTAATAVIMTGAAIAQYGGAQSQMTANIPFNFQFGGVNLPAGEYRVDTSRALESGLVLIRNAETKQAVISVGSPVELARGLDNRPRLVFGCGEESGCVLNQVWSPVGESKFLSPKPAGPQYAAFVALTSRAD